MRLDAWYAYYHRHWWCRRRQFTHFKRAHLWWNGLALLLMASGLIVGPVLKNSWVVAGLAAVSTLVKGWIKFRNWGTLVQLSRFAYTTYAKTLIELRTWARSGDDGDPAAFLVKMQTLDDMVTDFVPPLTDTYRRVYEVQYLLQHANQDQINALSELVLNLLKRRIPLTPPVMARLRRYKTLLRDVGKRRHSTKLRRELLMNQVGRGLWTGLKEACQCVLPLRKL